MPYKDKEKLKQYHKEYYKEKRLNPEWRLKEKERHKKYDITHPEVTKRKYKKFHTKHKFSLRYDMIKFRSLKKGVLFDLNKEWFINWCNIEFKNPCHYCGKTYKDYSLVVTKTDPDNFSIDRREPQKGYTRDNIIMCCFRCNNIKGEFFNYDEMIKIGEIIKNRPSPS